MSMFGTVLAEAWPQNDSATSASGSEQLSAGDNSVLNPTVAINPEKHATGQWKQLRPQGDHLGNLFEQDTSLSDLSSVSEHTRKLKLFTNAPNTYTNNRLNALATSLQGRDDERDESAVHHGAPQGARGGHTRDDVVGDLMENGENVLSKIRKASNLDMRAEYDTSLEDLQRLDNPNRSNGSTLSALSDDATSASGLGGTSIKPFNAPSLAPEEDQNDTFSTSSQPQTVRFKSPLKSPRSVADLAINDSINLEQKPSMSFVSPVRREMYVRRGGSTSAEMETSDPREEARRLSRAGSEAHTPQEEQARSASGGTKGGTKAPSGAHPRRSVSRAGPVSTGSVRHRPQSARGNSHGASHAPHGHHAPHASSPSTSRVFDISVAVSGMPLRDLSLPHIPEDTSIARKNVSFSGSLAQMVHEVTDVDATEINLEGLHIDCLQGLDELLPNLRSANLRNNNLRVVEGLPPSCLEVDFSHNELNRISTFPLSFITTLDISHNFLEDLSGLRQLRVLAHLDASNNALHSLKGLEHLSSLHTLNVSNNSLKLLDIQHTKLVHLKASANQLQAAALDCPALETLVVDNNPQLALLEGADKVRHLAARSTRLVVDNAVADEVHCDTAGNLAATVVSCEKFNTLSYCAVLELRSSSLLPFSARIYPIQQLDLVGLGLRSLPAWLPNNLPNLRCLNLAFNQLDDSSYAVLNKLSLYTLSLFGNKFGSLPRMRLGALDLRGNPVTEALYPDMKTFLLEAGESPAQQYDTLLGLDWARVMDQWRNDEHVAAQFDAYFAELKALKLWWLDGAEVGPARRYFTHARGRGIGALRVAGDAGLEDDVTQGDMTQADQSVGRQSGALGTTPAPSGAPSSTPQTEEFDMRHHFSTPPAIRTPSRVNETIGTIGKAKTTKANMHSTPAPHSFATPQTSNPSTRFRPLGKDMLRTRRTPGLWEGHSRLGPLSGLASSTPAPKPVRAQETPAGSGSTPAAAHAGSTHPAAPTAANDNEVKLILAICRQAFHTR